VSAIAQITLSDRDPGDFLVGGLRPVALVKEFAVIFLAMAATTVVSRGPSSLAPTDVDLVAIESIVAE
jgi:hypothetical protein